jgi:hypothetical protein
MIIMRSILVLVSTISLWSYAALCVDSQYKDAYVLANIANGQFLALDPSNGRQVIVSEPIYDYDAGKNGIANRAGDYHVWKMTQSGDQSGSPPFVDDNGQVIGGGTSNTIILRSLAMPSVTLNAIRVQIPDKPEMGKSSFLNTLTTVWLTSKELGGRIIYDPDLKVAGVVPISSIPFENSAKEAIWQLIPFPPTGYFHPQLHYIPTVSGKNADPTTKAFVIPENLVPEGRDFTTKYFIEVAFCPSQNLGTIGENNTHLHRNPCPVLSINPNFQLGVEHVAVEPSLRGVKPWNNTFSINDNNSEMTPEQKIKLAGQLWQITEMYDPSIGESKPFHVISSVLMPDCVLDGVDAAPGFVTLVKPPSGPNNIPTLPRWNLAGILDGTTIALSGFQNTTSNQCKFTALSRTFTDTKAVSFIVSRTDGTLHASSVDACTPFRIIPYNQGSPAPITKDPLISKDRKKYGDCFMVPPGQ